MVRLAMTAIVPSRRLCYTTAARRYRAESGRVYEPGYGGPTRAADRMPGLAP